ncbi:MAG: hypothetical protein Q4A11_00735 [Brachymonas sp.]|nr:hypothetical protein [Brachymonas sp.]
MKKQKGKKKEGPTKHAPSGALQCLQMLVWIGLGGVILPKARSKSATTAAQRLKKPLVSNMGRPRRRALQARRCRKRLTQPFFNFEH